MNIKKLVIILVIYTLFNKFGLANNNLYVFSNANISNRYNSIFLGHAGSVNILNNFNMGTVITNNKGNFENILYSNSNNTNSKLYYLGFINYNFKFNNQTINFGFVPYSNNYFLQFNDYFNNTKKQSNILDITSNKYYTINYHVQNYGLGAGYSTLLMLDSLKLQAQYVSNSINLSNAKYKTLNESSNHIIEYSINFYNEYKDIGYGFATIYGNEVVTKYNNNYVNLFYTIDYLGASVNFSALWKHYNNYTYSGYNLFVNYNFLRYYVGLQYNTSNSFKLHNLQYIVGYNYLKNNYIKVAFLQQIAYNLSNNYNKYYGVVFSLEYKLN